MSGPQNNLKNLMEKVLGICEIVPAENAQLPLCAMAEMLARKEATATESIVKAGILNVFNERIKAMFKERFAGMLVGEAWASAKHIPNSVEYKFLEPFSESISPKNNLVLGNIYRSEYFEEITLLDDAVTTIAKRFLDRLDKEINGGIFVVRRWPQANEINLIIMADDAGHNLATMIVSMTCVARLYFLEHQPQD